MNTPGKTDERRMYHPRIRAKALTALRNIVELEQALNWQYDLTATSKDICDKERARVNKAYRGILKTLVKDAEIVLEETLISDD